MMTRYMIGGWVSNLGLERVLSGMAAVCYPSECRACGARCEGGWLCGECAQKLAGQMAAPFCGHCAKPVAAEGAPCPWCLGKGLYPLASMARLGEYESPLKELIYRLKYAGDWGVGEMLAEKLAEQAEVRRIVSSDTVLAPVPLHRLRQLGRGYNQAHIIAHRLARLLKVKVIHPVARIRDTESQTQIRSQLGRKQNVRGAFRLVRPKIVTGRKLVLVDDVTTTGATIQEVGRALRAGRPASVSAIVLAVTDPTRRDFQMI